MSSDEGRMIHTLQLSFKLNNKPTSQISVAHATGSLPPRLRDHWFASPLLHGRGDISYYLCREPNFIGQQLEVATQSGLGWVDEA